MHSDRGQGDYEEYTRKRDDITTAIINSKASKKLIIAGPGTGKSYLFQQICKRRSEEGDTKILALSFINELVDDLARDLSQLAEVKTLHSFALGNVHSNQKMFLHLGKVIERDYAISFGNEVDFNRIFCNLIDAEEELKFYSERRRYYNYFSPNCSVYTLIKMFEDNENRIPEYSLILIDEYQDFNKLESRLLFFLSGNSPVVIVGDDDQSLYEFKYADPADIRSKYSSGDYETFGLPYCTRCTKVIIDAFGKLIETAISKGYLQDRASKDFIYYPSEKKDRLSATYPRIILKRNMYQGVLAYNIDKDIQEVFDPSADHMPTVLIICPLRKQIEFVEKGLRARGYKNIDASKKDEYDAVMEGFILLQNNSSCNLAWRMLFEAECNRNGTSDRFEQVMKESFKLNTPFRDLLEVDERRIIRKEKCIT
ncbi:MAG: AAA family ATPase [Candidatus Marinimicrobia bacterium]|nr:AAA family ATPase [Candidatus Neomarinimicrobiota bacterium]